MKYRIFTILVNAQENCMDAVTTSLIGAGVALFGIVSAFGGVLIGQRMARSTQREQWLRDNRKQEYRELLSSLSDTFLLIIKHGTEVKEPGEIANNVASARRELFTTLHDRIFIAKEIKGAGIWEKWRAIFGLCSQPVQEVEAMEKFSALRDELVQMALADPPR
jgi:hypothetical protein